MNKLLKFLTPFFALAFVALLALNVVSMLRNPFISDGKASKATRSSHFAFFLPEADYSFFKELKNGAIEAAEAMDCSISFHSIDIDPRSFEMARFTGIDGLAVYPYPNNEPLLSSLEKIYESGLPIVQIENQMLKEPKAVFIGTNDFDFGKAIGRLSLASEERNLKIALVYSDKNPGLMTDDNLLEMGIKSMLGKRVSFLHAVRTSQNFLDAEKLTYDLVQSGNDYNLLVFTDVNDTMVAVQAIIDMNLVGSVQIIGFGNDPLIQNYVNKGIMLGSIVRDPYHIGFSAVRALAEIRKSGNTSAFVDTGISILEKGNSQPSGPGAVE